MEKFEFKLPDGTTLMFIGYRVAIDWLKALVEERDRLLEQRR